MLLPWVTPRSFKMWLLVTDTLSLTPHFDLRDFTISLTRTSRYLDLLFPVILSATLPQPATPTVIPSARSSPISSISHTFKYLPPSQLTPSGTPTSLCPPGPPVHCPTRLLSIPYLSSSLTCPYQRRFHLPKLRSLPKHVPSPLFPVSYSAGKTQLWYSRLH